MNENEVLIFVTLGFLESGKTTYIQKMISSESFYEKDDRVVILCCEEGEVEYDLDKCPTKNVFVKKIDDISHCTTENFEKIEKEYRPTKIILEYNGMWLLQDFFMNIPDNWMPVQGICFVHSPTFISYNQNMRNLMFEKLQNSPTIVFNRFKEDYDKMEFHKIVRVANMQSGIFYEYEDGKIERDTIKDPMPFDDKAKHIKLEDKYFAYWFRDINEEAEKYKDKTITVKGRAVRSEQLSKNEIGFGRKIMTCCAADIQYCGLVTALSDDQIEKIENGGWYILTAKIKIEYNKTYDGEGPVLHGVEVVPCEPLEDEVATF